MRLDEMKYHIPETPDFIHTLVQSEVEKQLNTADNIVQMKRPKKKVWTLSKVAAIVIVCVTAVSTAAYAGVRIYHMYIERRENTVLQQELKQMVTVRNICRKHCMIS